MIYVPESSSLEEARRRASALAARLRLPEECAPYAAHRLVSAQATGNAGVDFAHAATLHLDDMTAIPFLQRIVGVEEYQHRARVRARTGDLVAVVTPSVAGYEEYCRDRLGLGEAELVQADL